MGPVGGPQPEGSGMLVSRAAGFAFAHYPKTGGCSLNAWFKQAFPDSRLLVPDNPHVAVRHGLELLAAEDRRSSPLGRGLILGVLREPFEMIVSLYEYWRSYPFTTEPSVAFIRCARHGTFNDFVHMGIVEDLLQPYEWFFDVDGPAWHRTRLLDFRNLQAELGWACDAAGLRPAVPTVLGRLNARGGNRDVDAYREQAGDLVDRVHDHFRWYYDHGLSLLAGNRPTRQAA